MKKEIKVTAKNQFVFVERENGKTINASASIKDKGWAEPKPMNIYGGGWNAGRVNASRSKYRFWIGIDTGVKTGFAIWDRIEQKLISVKTYKIHEAMEEVTCWIGTYLVADIIVRFEDARLRKYVEHEKGREVLQGVGSVKRDALIWEDFLTDKGINFEKVAPKNNKTKVKEPYFKKLTGWEGTSSEHGRDAAMLVFKM